MSEIANDQSQPGEVTDLAAFTMAGCTHLDRLEELLALRGNSFTPSGVAALHKRSARG